ncbi:MAG: hypothetical protein K2I64_02650 [Muribaculaceae bacterium]|nr:hypothetical protein [Muribaculaceae bacterium]
MEQLTYAQRRILANAKSKEDMEITFQDHLDDGDYSDYYDDNDYNDEY